MISFLGHELRDLVRFRMVTWTFITSTLQVRYKRSILGFLWSLLGPIFHFSIVGFVFAIITRSEVPNYPVYVLSGSLIYGLVAAILNTSTSMIINNEGYIRKIYLPKSIFVLNQVLLEFVNFSFGFVALFVLGIATGYLDLNLSMLVLPFILFLIFLFAFSLALTFATIAVFFRDLNHVIPIFTQIAFFTSPVLYKPEGVPEAYRHYLVWNPIYYVVESFRYPLYEGRASFHNTGVLTLLAVGAALIACVVYRNLENKIVFRL